MLTTPKTEMLGKGLILGWGGKLAISIPPNWHNAFFWCFSLWNIFEKYWNTFPLPCLETLLLQKFHSSPRLRQLFHFSWLRYSHAKWNKLQSRGRPSAPMCHLVARASFWTGEIMHAGTPETCPKKRANFPANFDSSASKYRPFEGFKVYKNRDFNEVQPF